MPFVTTQGLGRDDVQKYELESTLKTGLAMHCWVLGLGWQGGGDPRKSQEDLRDWAGPCSLGSRRRHPLTHNSPPGVFPSCRSERSSHSHSLVAMALRQKNVSSCRAIRRGKKHCAMRGALVLLRHSYLNSAPRSRGSQAGMKHRLGELREEPKSSHVQGRQTKMPASPCAGQHERDGSTCGAFQAIAWCPSIGKYESSKTGGAWPCIAPSRGYTTARRCWMDEPLSVESVF